MNPKEKIRVIESYSGKGKIYQGEQFIDEVDYFIKEIEQLVDPTLLVGGPTAEIAGARSVCGIVESAQAELLHNYLGAKLTLHLQGGCALDFAVVQKIEQRTYLIKSLEERDGNPQQINGVRVDLRTHESGTAEVPLTFLLESE